MISSALLAFAALLTRGLMLLHSYIAGNGAFPPPLTEDEERQMLERKEAGDEEARNILVERNLRLVAHVVKKYDVIGEETEDVYKRQISMWCGRCTCNSWSPTRDMQTLSSLKAGLTRWQ